MLLKILLVISILLQLVAALVAIGLTRRTKFNFSWILLTIALTLMAVTRFAEYIQLSGAVDLKVPKYFFVWLGVVTSLCFAVGVFYFHNRFNYTDKLDFRSTRTARRILNATLRTEEKERLRFSKELHDGLGPLLSSAKMSLSALKIQDSGNKEIVENTRFVIDEAIRSLREISNNLSPHILNDFGLARGVSNFIGKLSPGTMEIDFKTNLKEERFDTEVEVILYRVLCELINNSLKHSKGRNISMSLQLTGDDLVIDYRDDGVGFNPETVADMGMGLSNISSRVSSLKGTSEIISSRGNGMRARITVNPKSSGVRRKK